MMNKALTYYIAGAMSGVPQFNIPLFDAATRALRAQNFKIVSPAELDNGDIRMACLASKDGKSTPETNGGGTWGDFLARDVKLVSDQVGGIIVLPNWQRSRGARLEVFVGLLCGKQFGWYDDMTETAATLSPSAVRVHLMANMP